MRLSMDKGVYFDADRPATHRFTVFVGKPGTTDENEEIDVDAATRAHAVEIADAALDEDYKSGLETKDIVGPRVGCYM